jgi:hypothetical protein
MDPRNGYAIGGLILFALVWLGLVPVAIWSGFKRRRREAHEAHAQEPTVKMRVTTWQGFAGSINLNEPRFEATPGPRGTGPSRAGP